MVLLQQMLIFFIMMLAGLAARKFGVLTRDSQKHISAIVVSVANPALLLSGAMGGGEKLSGNELLTPVIIALSMFAVLILLARFVPRVLGFKGAARDAADMMLVFSNIGFMGIPLVSAIYGESAIIYVTIFTLPFNLLFYTYGIHIMSAGSAGKGSGLKNLLNIGVFAGILTIILYLLNVKVPVFISKSASMLGSLTGPLSMLAIGASLYEIELKRMFTNVRLLIFAAVKMVVLPSVLLLAVKGLIKDPTLLGVLQIMISAPVASMVTMLAKQHRDEVYELMAMGTSITTALSVLTVPLVSLITGIA